MDTEATLRMERVSARKADQDKNLFGRMLAAAMASRGQAQRLLSATSELSITEWRILWDLDCAGPLSVQDMASIQRTDHSLISRALPGMREKGYVKTARCARDKRQSLVVLSDAGKRAFAKAAPTMKQRRIALEAAFPDTELETFLALLTRFESFLAQPVDLELPLEEIE